MADIIGGDLKLVADLALPAAAPYLLPLRAFSKSAEFRDDVKKGDIIQVYAPSTPSAAADFNPTTNNYETNNDGTDSFVPVTINRQPKSTFSLSVSDMLKLTPQSLAEKFQVHVENVAATVAQGLFAQVTAANYPNFLNVGDADSYDAADVNALESAIAKKRGPRSDRYLINNMEYFKALRDDTTLSSNIHTGSVDVLRVGSIPGVYGFREVLRTSLLPAVGNLVGVATDASGLVFAQAIENPITAAQKLGLAADGLQFEISAEPVSGLMLCLSMHYDASRRRVWCTVETWCGSAVGRPDGLFRVINAADA